VWEVFIYNYVFVTFFFLGLNYTHLGKIPVKHMSLTVSNLKKWKLPQYIFIVVVLTLILSNLITALVMYAKAGIIFIYLGVIFGSIALLVIISLLLRKSYYFHLHHYVWGGLLMII